MVHNAMQYPRAGLPSSIAIDVGREDAAKNFLSALQSNHQRCSFLRTVLLHNRSSLLYKPEIKLSSLDTIIGVFSKLPTLVELKIELDYFNIPPPLIAKIFKNAKNLKSLVLECVDLNGSEGKDSKFLAEAFSHSSVRCITLIRCRGSHTLLKFAPKIPALKEIKLSSTCMAPAESIILALGCCPKLQSLSLEDIPDLEDRHVLLLGRKLAASRQLKEFKLISRQLGILSGAAITDLMMKTSSIQKLTLRLGPSWECSCASMATVLNKNTSLQSLDLLVYGVSKPALLQDIRKLAQALQLPHGCRYLRELNMCLDLDPMMDDSIQSCVVSAFQDVLYINETLGKLTLSEFGFVRYPLTADMETRLTHNRSGVQKLLRQDSFASNQEYVNALAFCEGDLDALYHALTNNPALFATSSNNLERMCTPAEPLKQLIVSQKQCRAVRRPKLWNRPRFSILLSKAT